MLKRKCILFELESFYISGHNKKTTGLHQVLELDKCKTSWTTTHDILHYVIIYWTKTETKQKQCVKN